MLCKIKYFLFFWLVCLTFIIIFIDGTSSESEIADLVYCRLKGGASRMIVSQAVEFLKSGTNGRVCTYAEGNLDLSIRGGESTSKVDELLTLLSKLQVITGSIRLLFTNSKYIKEIKFDSLRTIKGETLLENGVSIEILTIESQSLKEIIFPRLNAVLRGEIHILPNQGDLCKREMYWPEILKDPKTPYYDKRFDCKNSCHSDCPKLGEHKSSWYNPRSWFKDNKRYCYGPNADQCQLASRCKKRKFCSHCFPLDGSEECCNEQCAGGCNGPSARDCYTCANKWYKGECVPFCPPETFHRSGLCLEQCPSGFLIMGSECVDSCGLGYNIDYERNCYKCDIDDDCGKISCKIADDNGFAVALEQKHLASLVDCTHLYGTLMINALSFGTIKTVDDFLALSKLKWIEGNVQIDFSKAPSTMFDDPRMVSLFFLKNLETIVGAFSNDPQYYHRSYIASSKSLTYLGLSSLLQIIQTDYFYLFKCPKLIYANTVNWKRLGVERALVAEVSNENGTCDPLCDASWGCWGPGPYQCLRCAEFTLTNDDYRCVANCEDWGNFYTPSKWSINYNLIDLCESCHEECDGCTGDGPLKCKKCKNFKIAETGECVSKGNVIVVEPASPVKEILLNDSECPEGYKSEIVTNNNRKNLDPDVSKHVVDSGISLVCRRGE